MFHLVAINSTNHYLLKVDSTVKWAKPLNWGTHLIMIRRRHKITSYLRYFIRLLYKNRSSYKIANVLLRVRFDVFLSLSGLVIMSSLLRIFPIFTNYIHLKIVSASWKNASFAHKPTLYLCKTEVAFIVH